MGSWGIQGPVRVGAAAEGPRHGAPVTYGGLPGTVCGGAASHIPDVDRTAAPGLLASAPPASTVRQQSSEQDGTGWDQAARHPAPAEQPDHLPVPTPPSLAPEEWSPQELLVSPKRGRAGQHLRLQREEKPGRKRTSVWTIVSEKCKRW